MSDQSDKKSGGISSLFYIGAVGLFIIAGYWGTNEYHKNSKTQEAETNEEVVHVGSDSDVPESIINSLEYYTPDQYPDMYKTWGDDGVLKIKGLVIPAAKLILKSDSCDKLEYVMLDDNKSSPDGNIVFFADCENRKRFYVSDKDIAADRNVVSEQDKKHDTQGAVKRCEEKIKSNLAHPGTYSRHVTDTGTDITQVGDIRVVIGFTTKNGLGMEVDYRAICIDSDNGTDLMGISQK